MERKIPFMNLTNGIEEIYEEVMKKIEKLIKETQFIGGVEVDSFEEEFAAYCGMNYAVGCANGTDAIIIALKALGIGAGDTVIVPANTFIATSESVTAVGANVEFVDVEKDYYTMCPLKLEEYILNNKDKNIKAIIPVHLYGQMADMEKIMQIAKKYNLKVIEDSAQAHGAEYNNKKPGQYSSVATFSFYPGKNLGAFGDAGAIVTNDEELYKKMKMLVNHGRWQAKYSHDIEGYNMRIDTIQAAILRIKLKRLKNWTEQRNEKAKYYLKKLENQKNIVLPKIRENSKPVWHLFVIRVENRNLIQNNLKSFGISTGIHYPIPLHLQPAYSYKKYNTGSFPIAEKHSANILSLPLWPEMEKMDIDYVCEKLSENINKEI